MKIQGLVSTERRWESSREKGQSLNISTGKNVFQEKVSNVEKLLEKKLGILSFISEILKKKKLEFFVSKVENMIEKI